MADQQTQVNKFFSQRLKLTPQNTNRFMKHQQMEAYFLNPACIKSHRSRTGIVSGHLH